MGGLHPEGQSQVQQFRFPSPHTASRCNTTMLEILHRGTQCNSQLLPQTWSLSRFLTAAAAAATRKVKTSKATLRLIKSFLIVKNSFEIIWSDVIFLLFIPLLYSNLRPCFNNSVKGGSFRFLKYLMQNRKSFLCQLKVFLHNLFTPLKRILVLIFVAQWPVGGTQSCAQNTTALGMRKGC